MREMVWGRATRRGGERILDFRIEAAITTEEVWPLRVEMSETLRVLLPQLARDRLSAVRAEVEASIRQYSPATG